MDRLLALDEKGVLSGVPRERFTRERERIRRQIEDQTWSEKMQSYTSTISADELDASLLRIPWYGFEKADSPRMRGTYRAIREKLGAGNGLLYRYERQVSEGAFGICGFWSVEYLALGGGTLKEANQQFEQLLQYGNDLGLFAEETDPKNGEALGNFPQGFTHIGLISAALTLKERERGEQQPSEKTGSDVETSSQEVKA
jgi:GH15 family glucan-1,4-alpha-glucosidase